MQTQATMWQIARRPRWIGALVLALAIAGGFAALGQWQLSRSFESAAPSEVLTEDVVALDTVSTPQQPVPSSVIGQRVTVDASFVPGDYVVLSDRLNDLDSAPGYWVVGHAVAADGASIAVALGWAQTEQEAIDAAAALERNAPDGTISGRYLPSESPQESDFEAGKRSALAVSELVNLWAQAPAGVYGGYLVADAAASGLQQIDSPRPLSEVPLNLLNVFYAIEWIVFAGFAVFLWYRLVRDTWEEEGEALRDAELAAGSAPAPVE
ncbi:SURF1 family cytochrome oxidase biogenesis protein [Salinibacterium sp. G-O1]|uniref:SURF1 family protein n=1 Tax=Salinibacterium sp. G-O1 TaxID=3046208 RepID=UPI0024BAC311|nr:SURF1 family cytochrome oxidase biogenesis protein [Salinibacterium sp. G-O1]MDJ0334212.1 SURF1 family cytochrome oxidase biogenesis protein [Salinibacterium sp. G-O1]